MNKSILSLILTLSTFSRLILFCLFFIAIFHKEIYILKITILYVVFTLSDYIIGRTTETVCLKLSIVDEEYCSLVYATITSLTAIAGLLILWLTRVFG